MIRRDNLEDLYPLAPMQEGMLLHALLEPQSRAYREQVAYRVRGTLDVARLEACWKALARRHDCLRTVFVHEKVQRPLQMVLKDVAVRFQVEDLRGLDPGARDARAAAFRDAERGDGFDLAAEPPSRTAVLLLGDDTFEIVWTFHHIILDGWSVGLLLADLLRMYTEGGARQVPAPAAYSRYIQWIEARDAEGARRFWHGELAGFVGPTSIPSSRPGDAPQAYAAMQRDFSWTAAETAALERLAREHAITMGSLVLALWALVLARYQPDAEMGRHDLAFGLVVSGRPPALAEVDTMLGLFINTAPLRVRYDEGEPLGTFLARLQVQVLAAQEHAYLPLSEMQLAPGMIDHAVGFENFPRDARAAASIVQGEPGFRIESIRAHTQTAYDLNVVFAPGQRLSASFHFNASRHAPVQVERLFAQLRTLSAAASAAPHASVGDLEILPEEERASLRSFAGARVERCGPATLCEAIALRACEAPAAPAVLEGERVTSYGELDSRSGAIAAALRAGCRLAHGARVAVVLERGVDLPASWWGIMRAGAVFVPIDPALPDDRIAFMVADSECALVLTNARRREALHGLVGAAVDDVEELVARGASLEAPAATRVADCAYVIYTSGSTGTPKGVAVGHAGVLNVMAHLAELHPVARGDRVVFFASPSFDASIWEMGEALCHGAALVVADHGTVSDPARFGALLRESACTIAVLPPSYLRLVPSRDLASLKLLATAGEAAHPATAEEMSRHAHFVNLYGPTEASIHVTTYEVAPGERFTRSVPIGRPIPNVDALVLDRRGRLAPVGAPGELCASGVCVAIGYVKRPELDAERFVPHPFAPGERMYRTGDIVRWLDDGTLEFAGRADDQVKIRGHRVELGEIQARLLGLPGVRQAAVVVEHDREGADGIAAYVVPAASLAGEDVRASLRRALPEYMVPSRVIMLAELPLTPQGKIDRAALPKEAARNDPSIDAPGDPLEARLAGIWQSALGVNVVGVHDSFFDLGGHSLTAMRLASRVRKELGYALEVRELFAHPTIAGMAQLLRGRERIDAAPIRRLADTADFEVSHAQQRLWLLHHLSGGVAAYNIGGAFALDGAIDANALEHAVAALVARHESLRTSFVQVQGRPRQKVHPPGRGPIVELLDVSALPDPEAAALEVFREARARVFDLALAPLARFMLVTEAPSQHLLGVVLHHIVADEWSVQVMTRELSRLYASALSHGEAALGALAVQHRDVAAWLNSRAVKRDADYWRKQLGGSLPVLDLPIDRSRPPQRSFRGATRAFRVAPSTVAGLAAIARDARATRFMVLVAAVKVLLARYSGQQDIVVGHPAAGRDHPDLEGQVGLFVNTLALRDSVRPQASFRELVEAIRHTVLAALEHQAYPFDRIVSELGVARDASRDPVFDVMVAYDRASGEDLRLPGASVRALASDAGTSKFDLLFAFHERDTTLEGAIEYSTDLFDEATIARIEGHLATLMAAMVEAPDRAIGEHPLLTAGELRAIASPPRLERDPAESLVSRFDRVVARSPGDIAAVHGGERLTYRALDARATALARELAAAGAGPGIVAGLLVERSLDMLVGMLGILKSGSAYLPLDPALPAARLAAMMSDAKAPVVASVRRLESLAGALGARALYLDARAQTARVDVLPQARGHDLAYVMYTSGSTGRPNGVLVEHRNVLALLDAFEHLAPRREALAGTALCPSGFDVSVWEIFSCLCSGGTLHLLASETAADPRKIAGYFVDQGITSAYLPPALIDDVAGELARVAGARLDRLLVGVEPIRQGSLQRLCDAVPGLRIVNGYGPTEATVCATFHRFEPGSDPALRTPIGRAAWGYQVFLLDGSMQHVPPGVAGEIHVGGAGLARGYAGNAALTASRFVPNPFSTGGERLYRTGDLARALADGSIEFLGRADHQVKVRGFRIEPGEVEAALRQHRAIREACVLSRSAPSGGSQLVAFIAAELAPDAGRELRLFVKERLPEYMVPAAFVIRDILPRTANGKVDREALALLPLPEIVQGDAAPVNATEEMLQPLWRDVLGLDVVGCDDDFFDLGGHSLLATRLIARIHEACDIELPLRALFEAPTIRAVAAHIEAARERAPGEAALDAIPRSPRDTPLPLSFAQQRLWFVEELEPGPTYVVPAALELRGILDAERLEAALNALIARHEALRTRFVAIDGMPVQEVLAERPIQLAREDLRQADAASADEEVRRRAALLAAQPFDLANDALLRAVLVWLDDERHTLLISIHHIVVDGWSMGVLIRELAALYAGEELAPLPIQYADFAAWQHDPGRLESVIAPQLAYWRRELAGSPPLLALPTDRPRDPRRAKRAAVERFALDAALASRVRERARELEATPFMLLMAALDVVLARAAGQDDLAVGTPIANRTRTQIEGLIGFFANTIVIRVRIDEEMPFAAVVARVREAALSAYAHQEAPFEQVVEALQPERTLGHTPLFQVLFVMQNLPLAPVEIPGLRIRALEQPATTAKFDLTLAIEEREGGFACAIEYDADLFDAATVRSLAEGFRALTAAAVADPATAVGRLALMSPESRRALIERQSRNPPASSPHDTVTAFIAAQVARTPAATAVEDGAIALSYRELDERANQLAHHLRGIGADRGERIGLCMPRSAGQLVALLAILKSGAAVVPLDPGLPPDRLATMLREAAVRFVVTRGAVVPGRSIDLDLDGERAAIARQPVTPAVVTASSEDLLYVVFTSGSTGVPKAVLLPHRVLANLIAWGRAGQGFERPARTLQFTPISFDVSFQEIFTCWSSGGAIVVIDEDRRRDSAALLDFLRESGIERLFLPFVALQGLAEAASGRPRALLPSALRRIITAGEQLRATSALTELFTRLGHCELHNHYGPSETHVLTAHRLAGPPSSWPPLPPIGYAIAGARLYVLDRHRELVPPGMAGELYAAGIPVAQGYANQPELTAERFLPDPFAGEGVMYRTGDRVRMRADGDYEYLGRGDTQVKVRGLRIEPGEIEVALARHSQVADAAVVPDERSASVRLVAYVVPAAGSDLDIAALRRHLREILPEPMVPALFAILPKLPLGASGKVDRRALAALASLAAVEERRTVPPRTPTERVLGELYAEVLEIPVVGADDGFFELGGHSLLATRLIARVRRAFGVQLPLRRLFEAPTVAELARVIDEAPRAAAEAAPLVAVDRARPLPLSFAQERLWFLDRLGMGAAYNMPAALRLSGALDVGALGKAIDALASRHEILRTRFVERAGVPAQMVCMAPKDAMQRIDLSRLGDAAQASAVHGETLRLAREPFDLAAGPAVRWTLLRLGPRENVLILVLHHILADGWSIAILTRELTTLYCAFAAGRPSPLPPLALQYGDFACWQRSTAAGDASQRQYWARQLADAAPDIHLAIDRSRSAAPSLQGGTIRFAFDASLTASLKMLAERQKATLHATLLAAFAVLLARASGQEDLTIGTPVGHRPRAELEPLVGLFLNVLPIRIACGMQATSAEVCQAVQATMLDAFAHGDLPFEQIVEVAGGSRQDAHAPLFQVMFVLQGGAASIALPGIDIAPLELESTLAKYDLTLAMEETGGGLAGTLEYAADRLDAETAAELAAAYRTIARAMAENEGTRVVDLRLGEASAPPMADEHDFAFDEA